MPLCRVSKVVAHGKGSLTVNRRHLSFFAECRVLHTAKPLPRARQKKPTAKRPFADAWLPWSLCRVPTPSLHVYPSYNQLISWGPQTLIMICCSPYSDIRHKKQIQISSRILTPAGRFDGTAPPPGGTHGAPRPRRDVLLRCTVPGRAFFLGARPQRP